MKKLIYILFLLPFMVNAQKGSAKIILFTTEDCRVVYALKGNSDSKVLTPKNHKAEADFVTIESGVYDVAVYCRVVSEIYFRITRNGKTTTSTIKAKRIIYPISLNPSDKLEINVVGQLKVINLVNQEK